MFSLFLLHSLATRVAVGFIQLPLPPPPRRMLGTDGNPGKQALAYSEVETASELRSPRLSCSSRPAGEGLSPAVPLA